MNATIAVRPGRIADRAFVGDLGLRTVGDSISEQRGVDLALARASFERLLDFAWEQSHVVLVAEEGAEMVGFLLLLDRVPDEVTSLPQAFVAYMAVEPGARGRGVGSALLAAAESAARERGLSHIALMVTENNVAARHLYARSGFGTERRLLCKSL